jgi:hypothetical protein
MGTQKFVENHYGECFQVDISDEACGKFGFKHGDIVIDSAGVEGMIEGVSWRNGGDKIWFIRKGEKCVSRDDQGLRLK